jgi:ubiquinone biosynthesis protein UbiJ
MGTIAAALGALLLAVIIGFALLFVRLGDVEGRLDSASAAAQAADAGIVEVTGRLDDLQASVDQLSEDLSLADGSGTSSVPPELAATLRDIADQVGETRDAVRALDGRVDQICEGVPVC